MTEEQIERAVEAKTNVLDARLMAGELTQAAYDAEMKALTEWADRDHDRVHGSCELPPDERVKYVGIDPVRRGRIGTVERREPGWLHVRFDGETFTRKCSTIALEEYPS